MLDIRRAKVQVEVNKGQFEVIEVLGNQERIEQSLEVCDWYDVPEVFWDKYRGIRPQFYRLLETVRYWEADRIEALNAYLEHINEDEEAIDVVVKFHERYKGKFSSAASFVEQYLAERTDGTTLDYILDSQAVDPLTQFMFGEEGDYCFESGHVFYIGS